jgi:hypothetical protein
MKPKLQIYTFILLLNSAVVLSQTDSVPAIISDRPLITESPYLIPEGNFQVETGFIFIDRDDPINHIQRYSLAKTTLKYGVFRNLEVRAFGSYEGVNVYPKETEADSSYNGLGPFSAGFKVFVAEEKGIRPEMAIIGNITFRHIGDENFAPTFSYPSGKLACTHHPGKKLSVGYNIGFGYGGETADGFFIYSGYMGYKINRIIWSFAEAYGSFDNGDLPNHRADAGFTFAIRKNLQADLSAGLGFDKDVDRYFVNCGIAWRIPR